MLRASRPYRGLLIVSILGALASLAVLGIALSFAATQATDERRALVRFVCAAVDVAQEQQTPEALRRAERFLEILDSIGESCD